jgi:DNA (cytosine-5)-methyltransferase 1
MQGRSDGKPIRWPSASHAKTPGSDLFAGALRWEPARKIIDWSTPGSSIFTRKRPLKPNTIRRILAGAIRYRWPQPYIDALQALLDGRKPVLELSPDQWREIEPMIVTFRGTSSDQLDRSTIAIDDPIPSLTAGGGHLGLIMATGAGGVARDLDQPIPAVTCGGQGGATPHYITPLLMGGQSNATAKPVSDPIPTVTTVARQQLIEPLIAPYYGSGSGLTATSVDDPIPTIPTKDRFGIANPVILSTSNSSSAGIPRSVDEPIRTVTTAKGGDMAVASPVLLRAAHGDSDGRDPASRLLDPEAPLPTQTGSHDFGVAQAFIAHVTHDGARNVHGVDGPLPTITGANRGELAVLVPSFGERNGQEPRTHDVDAPLPTIAATGHIQLAQPAAVGRKIEILYRMLHYRELARGMSLDDEGTVYDFAGTKTDITKQIGNAVPCRTAKALVRAMMEDA